MLLVVLLTLKDTTKLFKFNEFTNFKIKMKNNKGSNLSIKNNK